MNNLFDRGDLSMSLKFGLFGLGMGGCSIASEIANIKTRITNKMTPYTGILINTNEVDLRKIPDSDNVKKYQLKGYEKGAGRDVEIGEKAFTEHKDEIAGLLKTHFSDREFVWVICGLGGGTGTGAVIEAIRLVYANGFAKRCGLILTLPRDKEGRQVLDNCLERLQKISQAMKGLGAILLTDNQKLYTEFLEEKPMASIGEYLDFSNKYIAKTLHEINVATASFNPVGGYHFDSSEFLNMLNTPGLISLSRISLRDNQLDADNESTYLPKIRDSISKGILSDGYNFKGAKKAAVSMIAPTGSSNRVFSMKFINNIEAIIEDFSPQADEKPVATYSDPKGEGVQIYSVFAGLPFPKRVSELIKKSEELNELVEEDVADDALSSLTLFSRKKTANEEIDVDSILGSKQELDLNTGNKVSSKSKSVDPFDFLKQ
ncbi:plasmid replication protein [Paenibacillus sp. FSL P4-0288]|uniref:plasmid replication protein n=1 Tax=Paenibacillus sp. FSL P4-0288 TaxID=2921633 RepID=UPI0030F549BE